MDSSCVNHYPTHNPSLTGWVSSSSQGGQEERDEDGFCEPHAVSVSAFAICGIVRLFEQAGAV